MAQGAKPVPRELNVESLITTKVAIQDEADHTEPGHQCEKENAEVISRPLMIYTRSQLLLLHESPLVRPPFGMPSLRDWFGIENEQCLSKRETEPSTPGSARDRRFRRDAEDSEFVSRPAFRSTLSQPSQMGNFKHQSRANDRDRGDVDKDRERDIKEKEGQEKLRNLSDKYDRERLALPANLTTLRNKEREVAPHLAVSSSSKASTQLAPATSRRADTRDTTKKKAGETSEDWRRADPHRSGRDERVDNPRKDRDERERPRSRIEDTSRQRRDPSVSKRDRDRDDRDRDRRERDRDESRKDKDRDDFARREKDPGAELDLEDPRRWRDDGKRDERMASRRDRLDRDRERTRDRVSHEGGHDLSHDRHQDRRWSAAEERDVRSKRSSGRDRRSGAVEEKDDRKDREREKEKEPAWMDTYVPSDSSSGILGGKVADGELDGIQAWKKGMKAKEQRDKGTSITEDGLPAPKEVDGSEKQLDEIQLFRLMMKREEEKKKTEGKDDDDARPLSSLHGMEDPTPGLRRVRDQQKSSLVSSGDHIAPSNLQAALPATRHEEEGATKPSFSSISRLSTSDSPKSLLSTFTSSSSHDSGITSFKSVNPSPSLDISLEVAKPPSSRIFPNPLSSETPPSATQTVERLDPIPTPSSASTQFNPPPGSRLLAFGTRTSTTPALQVTKTQSSHPPVGPHNVNGLHAAASGPQNSSHHSLVPNASQGQVAGLSSQQQQTLETTLNQVHHKTESARAQQGFSPFEDHSRPPFAFEELREARSSIQQTDPFRRTTDSGMHSDTSNTTASTFPANHMNLSSDPANGHSGPGAYATSKGSRFAKFFDGKAREGPLPTVKSQNATGFRSSSPGPAQQQEASNYIDVPGVNGDNRAIDDIFAMLSNSTQGQRGSVVNGLNASSLSVNVPFGQGHNNLHSLQQQHIQQQQHMPSSTHAEALYESRVDERNFMPDGLVPGLRSAPVARNRESNMFSESLDDFNAQRGPPQQRGLEQMYAGPLYQQTMVGRNVGLPLQQPHYRGGPSPISNQNSLQNLPQRLPHGLANLGSRTPHESSQFLGIPGMPSGVLHGTLHGNGPSQPFNNFVSPGGGPGYSGGPQMRLPPPGAHQLQNPIAHNPMSGLGHPGNTDLRGSQAQLLGMGGPVGGGTRGGSGGFGPQQGPANQLPLLTMRQPQQHLPPHMIPHLLPPHLQQPGLPGANNQPAHDLMALLMGGTHRE